MARWSILSLSIDRNLGPLTSRIWDAGNLCGGWRERALPLVLAALPARRAASGALRVTRKTCLRCDDPAAPDHRGLCVPCYTRASDQKRSRVPRTEMRPAEIQALRARVAARMAERGVALDGAPLQGRRRAIADIVTEAGPIAWTSHRPADVAARRALFARLRSELQMSAKEIGAALGVDASTVSLALRRAG